MSALAWGMDCRADQGALDEIRNCAASKADARRTFTDEQTAARAARPPVLEITGDRFTYIPGQWEFDFSATLAT